MDKHQTNEASITYFGPPGAGLGFALAGMSTVECVNSQELLRALRQTANDKPQGIFFVDEVLAESILPEIEKINEDTMPAIVLLANPMENKKLAAQKMNRLMVRAVGSDIFNT